MGTHIDTPAEDVVGLQDQNRAEWKPPHDSSEDWWFDQRFGMDYVTRYSDNPDTLQLTDLTRCSDDEFFHNPFQFIACSEESRRIVAERVLKILERKDFFNLPRKIQAIVLLFTDWKIIPEEIRQQLISHFGEPIYESLNIVPAMGIHLSGMNWTCGEMEGNMLSSRKRVLLGSHLLLKLFGTEAAISDQLLVFQTGNIILPFVWYYPDEHFVQELRARSKTDEQTLVNMNDFPVIGLQVMRNSPAFPGDEGWDFAKHSENAQYINTFRDANVGLPSLINTKISQK